MRLIGFFGLVVLMLVNTMPIAVAQIGEANNVEQRDLVQQGFGLRRGQGRGANDPRHAEDRQLIHFLLANHEQITRTVKQLPNGVETLTESDDARIAAKIKEHVKWMEHRIKENHPIRRRDPLFAEIFRHTDKIRMQREETEQGVRVIEISDDPYVATLIKAHAKAVSGFVARGFTAARENHSVPNKPHSAEAEEK